MIRSLISILLLFSLVACFDDRQNIKSDPQNEQSIVVVNTKNSLSKAVNVILFGDSSYKLTLNRFDTTEDLNTDKINTVLTLNQHDQNQINIVFRDSLHCMSPDIEFKDFNNDKVNDVLIFHSTGARANPTYYLYLTDLKKRKLTRVMGFEKLPNPDLDLPNNIITSVALSGFLSNTYSFYIINSDNKLVDLGHGFQEDPKDSLQYEKAIKKIMGNKTSEVVSFITKLDIDNATKDGIYLRLFHLFMDLFGNCDGIANSTDRYCRNFDDCRWYQSCSPNSKRVTLFLKMVNKSEINFSGKQ